MAMGTWEQAPIQVPFGTAPAQPLSAEFQHSSSLLGKRDIVAPQQSLASWLVDWLPELAVDTALVLALVCGP